MTNSTTVIPVLWPRKDKNGLFPIKIRVTTNRKSTYQNVGVSIKKIEWSEFKKQVKSIHEDYEDINDLIIKMVDELESEVQQIKPIKNQKKNFLEYLLLKIEHKKDGNKYFSSKRYGSLYYHLLKFSKSAPIYFTDIDKEFIIRFKSYLEKNIKSRNDKNEASINTVVNYLKVFKTILNHALNDEVIKGVNPIPSYLIPSKKKVKKVPLSNSQIWILNELRPENELITKGMMDAINTFMFSFWSRGLRISDVLQLKYKNFTGEYFKIVMEKTDEIVNVPLTVNNIERIMPYLVGHQQFFDWDNRKYLRYSDQNIKDDKYFNYTNEINELLDLHTNYMISKFNLKELLMDRVDEYNKKLARENRKKTYFHQEFKYDSKMMLNSFKNSDDIEEKFAYDKYMENREIYLLFCKKYFINFCKNKNVKDQFVFPFLRGSEHLRGFKMGDKISAVTALINKNLYKVSERFELPKFTTHFARHSFTSASKMMGVDIYDLRNWLGHTSVKNTEIYVNTIEDPKDDSHSLELYDLLNS
jgi:integrase/recombinase XerD